MTEAEASGTLFWEKLPEETSHAYQAFAIYRDQGITRSLRSAAAAFYTKDGGGAQREPKGGPKSGTSGQIARFKEWSRRNMWTARVEAFDANETRERSLRMRKYRDEMIETHHKIARLGENVLATKLYDVLRGEDYIPASALPGLINAVTNLHRLTLGEATERVEQQTGDQSEFDYSQLTDEELDLLIRIGEKLYGG